MMNNCLSKQRSRNPYLWKPITMTKMQKPADVSLRIFSQKRCIWSQHSVAGGSHPNGCRHDICFSVFCQSATLNDPLRSPVCAVKPARAWGKQVRPATESNCISEITDIHVAHSLFPQTSGYNLYFFQEWPTNAQSKKLSLLCGEVNESHYPPVISFIEFKPIMKEGIKAIRGFFFPTFRQSWNYYEGDFTNICAVIVKWHHWVIIHKWSYSVTKEARGVGSFIKHTVCYGCLPWGEVLAIWSVCSCSVTLIWEQALWAYTVNFNFRRQRAGSTWGPRCFIN